jgi:hypothetical protein
MTPRMKRQKTHEISAMAMKPWPKHPKIYEINTWVWLQELSLKHNRSVTLSSVPQEEWDYLASFGFDAVWFMGVWERSQKGIQIALRNEGLMDDFRRALPDLRPEDIVGSPYCVRRYVVDDRLGGADGLATSRKVLHEHGLRLILDFVPNHVAPDHPWVSEHPEYFIRGNDDDLKREPLSFIKSNGNVFACGRDPYFPAWPDVLQLNAFDLRLRKGIIETITSIAGQCDGIRCDMAMLMLNAVFERTWGARAGKKPDEDYWTTIIPAIRKKHQEFRFIAEAYWELEWELQQQGFDYCYDKRLYDRMEHSNAESIRQHLLADLSYQERLVRFIENHDEPRAAATFSGGKARAAAVAFLTIPGAKLLHEGQAQGFKVRLPVFLGRRPLEQVDQDLLMFYERLLNGLNRDVFRNGKWKLCERIGWPDNQSFLNIIAWYWTNDHESFLIIVNFRDTASQARVKVPQDELRGKIWHLVDILSGDMYDRNGDDMRDNGLHVDLGPWKYHFFQLEHL